MKLLTRRTIIRTALMLTTALSVVLIPTTASASKVYIDVPGITIGFHGHGHHDRHYKRNYKKRYHNRHYRDRGYRNRNYYGNRNYYPNNRRYNNNYYKPRSNYYKRSYRREYCPIDGYSPYYNDKQNCYRHKDHFHCS